MQCLKRLHRLIPVAVGTKCVACSIVDLTVEIEVDVHLEVFTRVVGLFGDVAYIDEAFFDASNNLISMASSWSQFNDEIEVLEGLNCLPDSPEESMRRCEAAIEVPDEPGRFAAPEHPYRLLFECFTDE